MTPKPRIRSSISDLSTFRGAEIIKLVKSVANKADKVSINLRSIGGRAFVIAISDTIESGTDFTTWRFNTYIPDFHAMYYEIWRPLYEDTYYLDRVYFHLYKTKQTKLEETEYILLHCDASEPEDTEHSIYKQSPHLHIKCAEHPIPHSHFALNICDLHNTLYSLENLTVAIHNAIEMLDKQVLLQLT